MTCIVAPISLFAPYNSAYFIELYFSKCVVRKNGEALDPLKWVHL
jgi:hypothetical protein